MLATPRGGQRARHRGSGRRVPDSADPAFHLSLTRSGVYGSRGQCRSLWAWRRPWEREQLFLILWTWARGNPGPLIPSWTSAFSTLLVPPASPCMFVGGWYRASPFWLYLLLVGFYLSLLILHLIRYNKSKSTNSEEDHDLCIFLRSVCRIKHHTGKTSVTMASDTETRVLHRRWRICHHQSTSLVHWRPNFSFTRFSSCYRQNH